ncbi:MAG: hypothetical protein ACT6FF_00385 [Methanosarcinaceae archaeon]
MPPFQGLLYFFFWTQGAALGFRRPPLQDKKNATLVPPVSGGMPAGTLCIQCVKGYSGICFFEIVYLSFRFCRFLADTGILLPGQEIPALPSPKNGE